MLEIGSRRSSRRAWWADLRAQFGEGKQWIGIDMQPGIGVDYVANATDLAYEPNTFETVICCEMLEHAVNPRAVLAEAARVLTSPGWILITTPFCFPVHAFPDDYWRFTESGLRVMLEHAGFCDIETKEIAPFEMVLDDHGAEPVTVTAHLHVAAIGCHW